MKQVNEAFMMAYRLSEALNASRCLTLIGRAADKVQGGTLYTLYARLAEGVTEGDWLYTVVQPMHEIAEAVCFEIEQNREAGGSWRDKGNYYPLLHVETAKRFGSLTALSTDLLMLDEVLLRPRSEEGGFGFYFTHTLRVGDEEGAEEAMTMYLSALYETIVEASQLRFREKQRRAERRREEQFYYEEQRQQEAWARKMAAQEGLQAPVRQEAQAPSMSNGVTQKKKEAYVYRGEDTGEEFALLDQNVVRELQAKADAPPLPMAEDPRVFQNSTYKITYESKELGWGADDQRLLRSVSSGSRVVERPLVGYDMRATDRNVPKEGKSKYGNQSKGWVSRGVIDSQMAKE